MDPEVINSRVQDNLVTAVFCPVFRSSYLQERHIQNKTAVFEYVLLPKIITPAPQISHT